MLLRTGRLDRRAGHACVAEKEEQILALQELLQKELSQRLVLQGLLNKEEATKRELQKLVPIPGHEIHRIAHSSKPLRNARLEIQIVQKM
eukprot:50983-Amphidinium_carterae.1